MRPELERLQRCKINALQVHLKSAELERLKGLENQPGKVRQKSAEPERLRKCARCPGRVRQRRKIEQNRTLCEIVRKSEAKIRKSENGMFTFVVQVVHKIALR